MHLNKLMWVGLGLLWSVVTLATPSDEVLESCKNMKPINNSIHMKEIDGLKFYQKRLSFCRAQIVSDIKEPIYGAVSCKDKPYLIIANKKISMESAKNLSVNPEIKPHYPILISAMWWKIEKGDEAWMCVVSPLTKYGPSSMFLQYYLVEEAFNTKRDDYPLYFYFFDKEEIKFT